LSTKIDPIIVGLVVNLLKSLVELIEVDIKLEEELKEFEATFEKDRKM